ncbi:MAG: RecX family transcriptional regulator [Proteobacteria bacterium]|nr:RecX family transcriptional regulator [Pseudomonadota bacterium]
MKTKDYLLKVAEFYCSKRETSRANLGKYLVRKCREKKIDLTAAKPWIEEVLNSCEASRMVDDKRYSGFLIRDYTARGKGRLYIEKKLNEKGVKKEAREMPNDEPAELERALKLASKSLPSLTAKVAKAAARKADPKRRESQDKFDLKQKLLMKLTSAGFTMDISRKAITEVMATL